MSASKWIGGTLIALGGLTDVGAAVSARSCPPGWTPGMRGGASCGNNPVPGLVVGTGMAGAGAWLWSQPTHAKGSHRRRGRASTSTSHAAAIRRSRGVR